jgi:hypothetical protein
MNKVTTALQINAITGNGETLTVLGSEMRNWCQKVGLLDVNQKPRPGDVSVDRARH